MIDSVIDRLPALIVGIIAFFLFYALSFLAARFVGHAVSRRRQNLGVVFARLIQGATVMIGFLYRFRLLLLRSRRLT